MDAQFYRKRRIRKKGWMRSSLNWGNPFDVVAQMFAADEQGLAYDLSDTNSLYQDAAGTTPAVIGQPVGLVLDKRFGLERGPELVTNGGFDSDVSGWNATNVTTSVVSGVARVTATADFGRISQSFPTIAGKTYQVSGSLIGGTSTSNLLAGTADGSGNLASIASSGSLFFTATTTTTFISLRVTTNGGYADFDNISVKEIPGNHATQSTTASKPVLARHPVGGRRNLLTYTEDFGNAVWIKSGTATVTPNVTTAPDGNVTADLFRCGSTNASELRQINISAALGTFTASVRAKLEASNFVVVQVFDGNSASYVRTWFNLSTGEVGTTATSGAGLTHVESTITPDEEGFYLCTVTATLGATTTDLRTNLFLSGSDGVFNGTAASGIYVWGAQLETGSTATPYQKVVSQFDVTEAGVADLYYLWFDGVDDFLVTGSIDFTSTDEMSVFAGVRKLSDAAGAAILVEASANLGSNNGTFALSAPLNNTGSTFGFASKGTLFSAWSVSGSSFAAPVTTIMTGTGKITTDTQELRINGDVISSLANDQGTGNFGNYPLYIGRRGGSSLPFNGNLYSLIVRGKLTEDPTGVEAYVATKTGVTL